MFPQAYGGLQVPYAILCLILGINMKHETFLTLWGGVRGWNISETRVIKGMVEVGMDILHRKQKAKGRNEGVYIFVSVWRWLFLQLELLSNENEVIIDWMTMCHGEVSYRVRDWIMWPCLYVSTFLSSFFFFHQRIILFSMQSKGRKNTWITDIVPNISVILGSPFFFSRSKFIYKA